jgi:hypothetical protein
MHATDRYLKAYMQRKQDLSASIANKSKLGICMVRLWVVSGCAIVEKDGARYLYKHRTRWTSIVLVGDFQRVLVGSGDFHR